VSKEDMNNYLKLFEEYQDVFSWSYRELKIYDTHIIQHTIPLKCGVKPFQQKLRKYHPSMEPVMYQEIKKNWMLILSFRLDVDTERGVNRYQVQFKTFSTYT
jgi:hypothetical protein